MLDEIGSTFETQRGERGGGAEHTMVETNSREMLRGEEVAIFDFLAKTMTSKQWADWLRAPLELAAAEGDASLSQKMVGAGAEVGNALHRSIRGRHGEVVINLLGDAEAAVGAKDEDSETPLHVALRSAAGSPAESRNTWCETIVRLLLRKGADPNALGPLGTPLHYACTYRLLGATEALLEAGADCNIGHSGGREGLRSALDTAAGCSSVDIVRVLIGHGADVTASDPDGHTPLHQAGYSDFAEVADVLIEAGANVGVLNGHNETPLHIAASRLNPTMVRAFLNHGANVDHGCLFEQTPLHKAAFAAISDPERRRDAADVVDLLLRSGADETLVDDGGLTAGELAGEELEESMVHEGVVERMRDLFANAPADRAWRRRGYWALCRAHPNRLQKHLLRPATTRTDGSKEQSTHNSLRASITRAAIGFQSNGDSWAEAAVCLLGLGGEAIFRTIVGYL